MKILFLADDFPPQSFGGAGISTFELARGIKNSGHEVFVVTTCRDKKEAGESEYEGLKVFKIHSNYNGRWRSYVSLNNRPVIKQLETILIKVKPNVVHANNIHQYLSYKSLKISKKYAGVIWTARDTMAFYYGKLNTKKYLEKLDPKVSWIDNLKLAKRRWNPFRNLIIRNYLNYADRKVAISSSLQKALGINGIKDVSVIYNGIDINEWQSITQVEEFKTKFNLNGKNVILFSGRLSPAKGGEKSIEALAQIVKEIPNVVLLAVGSMDEYGREMRLRAKKLGVDENLLYTGWMDRDEIKSAYGVANIVLMPSLYLDPFGRVNIEAMAAKKPVVGTKFGGTPEIVIDGVTGYIVNPLNPKEIAEKCVDLLKDPIKAQRFGEAGFERLSKHFNLNNVVLDYLKVYESVSKHSGRF